MNCESAFFECQFAYRLDKRQSEFVFLLSDMMLSDFPNLRFSNHLHPNRQLCLLLTSLGE